MTIQEFISTNNLSMSSIPVPMNPHITPSEWDKNAKHYYITIECRRDAVVMVEYFYYSQGSGIKHKPHLDDVLDSLAMDSASVKNTTFTEWANEFGYDDDSIRAFKTYQACQDNVTKIKLLLGANNLQILLENVERL